MSFANAIAPRQTLVYRDAPMHNGPDQFAKNLLRDTLSLASLSETEVSRAAKNLEEDVSAEIQAWFQEYERKLRDEGHKEGHKEGERDVLLRLLRSRFGALPPPVVARVKNADANDIERWIDRILRAQTIAEVFADVS